VHFRNNLNQYIPTEYFESFFLKILSSFN